jgi:hypothetical protein
MYAPEIMKDQKTVKMFDSVRKLFDIEKFKNQYFSNIEFFYNSIVNLSDLELTVAASSPYHTFITTQKLANERPDLFKIKDDIHDVIYNSLNINTFISKDILEKLLKTNTMEEVEAILIPILNFAFESKHSFNLFAFVHFVNDLTIFFVSLFCSHCPSRINEMKNEQ